MLDKTDMDLINALRRDPRAGNRQLAQELGLSETTVLARIRELFDARIMRTTIQTDIAKMGNEVFAHVDVYVEGQAINKVLEDLCEIDEVVAVTSSLGPSPIVIQVLARDNLTLAREILPKIGSILGVSKLESDISIEILKYSVEYGSIK